MNVSEMERQRETVCEHEPLNVGLPWSLLNVCGVLGYKIGEVNVCSKCKCLFFVEVDDAEG